MKKVILMITLAVVGVMGLTAPVMAEVKLNQDGACSIAGASDAAGGCNTSGPTLGSVISNLIQVALGVVGVIAVVVVVIAGQRYLASAGDPAKAKQAKDMIMYGMIGLALALLSWAIVNFVAGSVLTTGQNTGGSGGSSGSGSGGSGGSSKTQQGGGDSDDDGGETDAGGNEEATE